MKNRRLPPKSCNKIRKLEASIRQGIGSVISAYEKYFLVGKKTQQTKAHQYIEGIFCAERGKRNIERMVKEVTGSEYESLQHFISDSPWDSKGLMLELAGNISRKLKL